MALRGLKVFQILTVLAWTGPLLAVLLVPAAMPVLARSPGQTPVKPVPVIQALVLESGRIRYLPDATRIEIYQDPGKTDPAFADPGRTASPDGFVPVRSLSDSARRVILSQPVQWLRLRLTNRDSVHTRFVFSSPADSTIAYLVSGNRKSDGSAGDGSVGANLAGGLKTDTLLALDKDGEPFGLGGMFRLNVPFGQSAWVYIRLAYGTTVSRQLAGEHLPSIRLYPESSYQQRYTVHLIRQALFYGAMLVMLLYHSFIFVKTRSRAYGLFSLFILGLCLFMASNAGYLAALGLPGIGWLNRYTQFCSAPLALLVYLLFCRNYLQPSQERDTEGQLNGQSSGSLSEPIPKPNRFGAVIGTVNGFGTINRIGNGLAAACLLTVGAVLAGYWGTGRVMAIWLTLAVMAFILCASVFAVLKGYGPARYFVAANSLFLVSALVFSTQQLWGPSSVWASYGLQIGAVVLVSVLSVGLVSRINWLGRQVLLQTERNGQLEKAAARQREQLILERQQLTRRKNAELEERIRERTARITEQNQEIQAQNGHLALVNDQLLSLQETISRQNQELADANQHLEKLVEQRTRTLQQTLAQLEQTLGELDTFLYRTSHDMRAPLASVMGLIELSQGETDPDEKQYYLSLIDRSVRRLDNLLTDINHYAKNKNLSLSARPVVFSELIEQLVEGLRFARNAQPVSFQWTITQNGPFYSDSQRLASVIGNLLSNAVRYRSDERPPVVSITVEVADQATIVITDNGIGIEKQFQSRIFEMFFRLSHQSEGSGLGLYIVRQTLASLGGSISVESTVGQGTSFTVSIPSLVSTQTGSGQPLVE